MKVYDPTGGSNVHASIANAIELAKSSGDTVQMTFNGVIVTVEARSDKKLICRDWALAIEGCLDKQVGPFPKAVFDDAELVVFAGVRAVNEDRKNQLQVEAKGARIWTTEKCAAKLADAPLIELSDVAAWATAVEKNSDPYGAGCIQYAERWARLMQVAMADGKQLADVAEQLSHDADAEGITGFMYGCAVNVLSHCWAHGDELRKWHNGEYNHDGDGVVNPAVMTIG